ncbi:MAG TPA: GNAT family N-acetyltransferase [Usitatibacter sp.]|jgi:GNAT superfamily N-acetyltransferase|nr:GNAT family N-acetyltransferase [Usitatibacter sp.]
MTCRSATSADALCLGVLATQVFLDTYATEGIRADLAREVLANYSVGAFAGRLADPSHNLLLAEREGHLIGFSDLVFGTACPVAVDVPAAEVDMLYVQLPFQGRGVGRMLLSRTEMLAREQGAAASWLSAWVGNTRALAFYAAMGYADMGAMNHVIEGQEYENRVLLKELADLRTANRAGQGHT